MSLLKRALEKPLYPFELDGKFYKPTRSEIWKEFFYRVNPLKTKKNWLPFCSWVVTCSLVIPFILFFLLFFKLKVLIFGLIYSMVVLGSHGTLYLHRYSTHRAFKFGNQVVLFIIRNLVIKIIPEEIYIISHHVHHHFSDKPGDPYNVNGGWLYCFLADANHQPISRSLDQKDYLTLTKLMNHTGVHLNTYEQYSKWGSLCHPLFTCTHFVLNWFVWYSIFFLIGGHSLACGIFGLSGIWAFGVRTFNYDGHGRGKDKRKDGVDFDRNDLSINQLWPGFVAGEWHNNHHLYPRGARSGFLSYQIDLPWYFIWLLWRLRGIETYHDYKNEFLEKYYLPYKTAVESECRHAHS
ncbi:MAG: acyl-CoA desaturase [Bacteriovoracia bacterium]